MSPRHDVKHRLQNLIQKLYRNMSAEYECGKDLSVTDELKTELQTHRFYRSTVYIDKNYDD